MRGEKSGYIPVKQFYETTHRKERWKRRKATNKIVCVLCQKNLKSC